MKQQKITEQAPSMESVVDGSKERWTRACSDLKDALSTWDELSKTTQGLSKDEQQLLDMKKLLKNLAKQVAEFS
jgi:hypothetical protein